MGKSFEVIAKSGFITIRYADTEIDIGIGLRRLINQAFAISEELHKREVWGEVTVCYYEGDGD